LFCVIAEACGYASALSLMQRQVLRSMDLVTCIESLSPDTVERRLISSCSRFAVVSAKQTGRVMCA
jgi:hypothetical protein